MAPHTHADGTVHDHEHGSHDKAHAEPKLSQQQLEQLQKSYMEMQTLDQQARHATRQLQVLDQQVAEIHEMVQNVLSLSAEKPGTKMFVPIATGVFAPAMLEKGGELLVNVGAGVVVPKSAQQVRHMLETQSSRVEAAREELTQHIDAIGKQSRAVEERLRTLVD